MQELEIKNVKTAQYHDFNLNQIYDYLGKNEQLFGSQRSEIASPYRSGEGKLSVNHLWSISIMLSTTCISNYVYE